MPLITSSNLVEAYILDKLKAVTDWADANGLDLFLGEIGTPHGPEGQTTPNNHSAADQALFNAATAKAIEWWQCSAADGREHSLTSWGTGHHWPESYIMNPYYVEGNNGIVTVNNSAAAYESSYDEVTGINYAHAAFFESAGNNDNAASIATLTDLNNRGVEFIRYQLGVSGGGANAGGEQNWLWDNVNQVLRPDKIGHVEAILNNAQQVGIDIVLNMFHTTNGLGHAVFAGNPIANSPTAVGPGYADYLAYANALLNHSFNDANGNPVTVGTHPNMVMVDPVNEPENGQTGGEANWLYVMQQMIIDFRAFGYIGKMAAVAAHYSGIQDFPNNIQIFTDPADNLTYTFHFYYDPNNDGGNGSTTWADYLAKRVNDGQQAFSEECIEEIVIEPPVDPPVGEELSCCGRNKLRRKVNV